MIGQHELTSDRDGGKQQEYESFPGDSSPFHEAYPSAMRHWKRVRDLAAEAPASDKTLDLGIAACGQILAFGMRAVPVSAAEAERLFQEACALARRRGDRRSLAALHRSMGSFVVITAGDVRRELELVTEAVRIANECDDAGLRYAAYSELGFAYFVAGRIKEGYELNLFEPRYPTFSYPLAVFLIFFARDH